MLDSGQKVYDMQRQSHEKETWHLNLPLIWTRVGSGKGAYGQTVTLLLIGSDTKRV